MATWPIKKSIKVGDIPVAITATKLQRADHIVVISVTAESNGKQHTENWTLPRQNPNYSKEQAQKDFDAHILKVATQAVSKSNADDVTEALV